MAEYETLLIERHKAVTLVRIKMQANGFAHNYGTNFFVGWERDQDDRR